MVTNTAKDKQHGFKIDDFDVEEVIDQPHHVGELPVHDVPRPGDGVRVKNPSVVVYDIAGKGFTRFRGVVGLENPKSEIGSTLNPAVRFFVFDTEPNMERLVPPAPVPAAGAPAAMPATRHPAADQRGTRRALRWSDSRIPRSR